MDKGKFYSGLAIMVGLIVLGAMIPKAVGEFRSYDRTVNVKGLCEKEVKADKVICMILVKMLFHFTLRVGIMCRLITSRATGKMLGRSILYGQRIWNLSTMKVI